MKKYSLLPLFMVFAIVLSACSSRLAGNRTKWNDQGISHYRYDLTISCFCPFRDIMPVKVETENGNIISMIDAKGQPLQDQFWSTFGAAGTIEGLFAIAEENLANADEVAITYDSTYGFPDSIVVDRIKAAVDDEISYYVENFEILK